MKVSEAIEKLTIKRDDVLHFQKLYKPGDVGWSANESKAIAFNIAINTLEQIDEPQAEKVEVPDFVAELIRKYKAKKETLVCSISNLHRESDEYKWYVDNAEIYERAWANGYTVKPKRWVVRAGDYHSTYVDSLTITSEKSRHTISGKEKAHYFTDRAKAEAVATLVEGSVEEA